MSSVDAKLSPARDGGKPSIIERYRRYLPVTEKTCIISLQEGDTPLIRARNLERYLGSLKGTLSSPEVYLKYEGANPTGSFKDRGMTMAITKAVEEGTTGVICASTGNTSASAAAYAARASIPCFVVIPQGKIAMGKLAQAVMHGARVIAVRGNFDQALTIVREAAERLGLTLVNSLNPYRIDGQMSVAWEVVDALGAAPEFHFLPVGNAGNITAHWRGYNAYRSAGKIQARPRLMGFQAAGSAPIVLGHRVEDPQTIATAIRIGNPASWQSAVAARDESGGIIDKVTDDQIVEAYRLIASLEGVFAEPASAASVAGLIQTWLCGEPKLEGRIVCTLTGHGLKDPERAIASAVVPTEVDADFAAVAREIENRER
ncbi:MAG: threonine synthase [Planctomycetes bacterium]|nr:threonine synthase [Planctomycetota bacterium]